MNNKKILYSSISNQNEEEVYTDMKYNKSSTDLNINTKNKTNTEYSSSLSNKNQGETLSNKISNENDNEKKYIKEVIIEKCSRDEFIYSKSIKNNMTNSNSNDSISNDNNNKYKANSCLVNDEIEEINIKSINDKSNSKIFKQMNDSFKDQLKNTKLKIQYSELYFETSTGFKLHLEEKFLLRSIKGEGGFGIVIKALEIETGIEMAIKVIPKGKASDNQESEFKIQSNINHRNIVQLYSVEENDEFYFLFMELMDGGTLKEFLVNRFDFGDFFLSEDEVRLIMKSLLEGVKYLHVRNIVHRDLKPGKRIL